MVLVKEILAWLFNNNKQDILNNEVDKFLLSARITVNSRYNASVRLQRQGKFSFVTIIMLSLGLVFIPLIQNAGIKLSLSSNVINMIQVFIAVAVLVYSIVISTARYDLRAETLRECGDKLKELSREVSKEKQYSDIDNDKLTTFQKRYTDITTDTENHEAIDFQLATLTMQRDFKITGISRAILYLKLKLWGLSVYFIPILLILFEIIFITDILGVTSIFTEYLQVQNIEE
ncbi:MAG: SLATT domain-containing protein [Arcobacteraceae bacterium]|nr:SLATT domain-containing protein [Arcobacteraceae bacterium]